MVHFKDKIISLRVSSYTLELLDVLVNIEKETKREKGVPWGREPSRSTVIGALVLAVNKMPYEEKKKLIHENIKGC